MVGLFVGHPLDTIKVRQQTIGGGLVTLTRSTFRTEGVRGFYKGLLYPMISVGPNNALFFGVSSNSLMLLEGTGRSNTRKMCCEGMEHGQHFHMNVFLAGCMGGFVSVLYSCPVEFIKTKLQSQTKVEVKHTENKRIVKICKLVCTTEPLYKGSWHVTTYVYKKYGIRGLYKGLWSMLLRDVPTFGLYTLAYEHTLCAFKSDRTSETSIISQIVAGGFAGVLSWIVVIPLDVIKSRIQADDLGHPIYRGVWDCAKKIYTEEGIRPLFAGTFAMVVRAFPVNAAVFVGYEFFISICHTN